MITDEGVGEDEELSHDRYDGDLGGFSDFDHGFVFGLEFRVQSDGVEGGHVESLSGSWAPAADGSLSMGLAAVPRDRRQTYEAGGLGVLETPELGRLDDEHVCGHLADAWNARQDVEPLAQVRVCVAQRFEASIDRFDLAVDLAQPLSELTLDEGRDGDGLAVEGCDAFLDECVAGVDEFLQGLDRLAGGGARLEAVPAASPRRRASGPATSPRVQ